MLNYHEYEKAVFDWLMAKRKQEPNFTFSLRKKISNGQEKDIFIGTQQSNYFATTFWSLPVSYPGSSGEATGIVFKLGKLGYSYFIELNQTNSPKDEQNASVLEVLKSVFSNLPNTIKYAGLNSNTNAMFNIKIKPVEEVYGNLELMFDDVDKQLAIITPLIDDAVDVEKLANPAFIGQRIRNDEFELSLKKLELRLEKQNNPFKDILTQIVDEVATTYFKLLRRLIGDLGLDNSSQKIYFNYEKDTLIFGIGQRYAMNVSAKGFYTLISKHKTGNAIEEFAEEKAYLTNYPLNENIERHYNELLLAAKEILAVTNKSSYYKFDKKDFRAMVFNASPTIISKYQSSHHMPLNQILYGPPGTGKTYKLKNEYFNKFTVKETELSKDQFMQQVLADLNWWQVITIVLLDKKAVKVRDIYEHPFIQVKERLSESKTVMPTIWGQLQAHTVFDCPQVNVAKRSEPMYFWKDEQSVWSVEEELVRELYPESYEVLAKLNDFNPVGGQEVENYEFVTFHQSYSYEDFMEGIKPNLEEGSSDISYKIEDGVFKRLCKKAENNPQHDYAIFIDEINRGNVSAIFGELITLIEESKRAGASEALSLTLPYSKEKFSVPSNLYIIGTMNTADRSVEALDTALRRRFAFEEMMPEPSKITSDGALKASGGKLEGIDLAVVLTKINERIAVLLDVDHQIGHSYLINVSDTHGLANAFNNCIVPLLKEYFYHDDEKIALVLGGGFVNVKAPLETMQALFPTMAGLEIHHIDSKRQFELKPITHDTIIAALQILLSDG
ncbi:McrB family protein [Pedobacter agri]|uniref:McrB family protein n=1 Tax=Pedobacter agri TaxID=454586 RepID=UPI0029306E1A|nr:AAA family ATPase [Pedobacter agri]